MRFFCVSMEDSSEQSHWVSPALLSSDPLASFSSEPGLLPPGEDEEAFFSSQDTDYTSLPSFFSTPSHSRAPSAYRHGSGQFSHPTVTHQIRLLMHPANHDLTLSILSHFSSSGVHLTEPPQQPPAAGRAEQPLPELTLQPPGLHLEQQPPHQDPAALTHTDLPLHPQRHLLLHHLQRRILISMQREPAASGGPEGRAPEPAGGVGGQQQFSESDSCCWECVHAVVPLLPTHAEPLQLVHDESTRVQLCCPLLQPWSMDQPLLLP